MACTHYHLPNEIPALGCPGCHSARTALTETSDGVDVFTADGRCVGTFQPDSCWDRHHGREWRWSFHPTIPEPSR